jgi:uncharacterized membrane protein
MTDNIQNPRVITTLVLGLILTVLGVWGFVQDPILGLFSGAAITNWVRLIIGLGAIFYGSTSIQNSRVFGTIATGLFVGALVIGLTAISFFGAGQTQADLWLSAILAIVFGIEAFTPLTSQERNTVTAH